MKRSLFLGWIILLVVGWAGLTHAEVVNSSTEEYRKQDGPIAFLGCVYTYQRIYKKSDKAEDRIKYIDFDKESNPEEAEAETTEEALKIIKSFNLSYVPLQLPSKYTRWFESQIPKKTIDPAFMGKLCGNKPYALLVVIDRYGIFPTDVSIRTEQDGQRIEYYGRPALLESEGRSTFSYSPDKTFRKVVAISFYLFSVKSGNLVWQANGVANSQHIVFKKIKSTAKKCLEMLFSSMVPPG